MSKAGNSYYYLQDELGSPMYMTGTDGAAVSSYAFDDFGRGIDPFTGKLKEHRNKYSNGIAEPGNKKDYTIEGNIIQPFAFTGYQEDEVSETASIQPMNTMTLIPSWFLGKAILMYYLARELLTEVGNGLHQMKIVRVENER